MLKTMGGPCAVCGPGGGTCGTFVFNPAGVDGVIVMKITSNTSRMSINGVTLISDLGDGLCWRFFILPPLFTYRLRPVTLCSRAVKPASRMPQVFCGESVLERR